MFESIQMAPVDPILGLSETFRNDPRPDKVNLTAGVYKDETGNTPVFSSVKKAEDILLKNETTKAYLPIDGESTYGQLTRELIFGKDHLLVSNGCAVTADTPGGTAALRVAAEFINRFFPGTTVWLSEPTWPNHPSIFGNAGLPTRPYSYYDGATRGLAFQTLFNTLNELPARDVVLLHACCHNPTGMDPTNEQWEMLAHTAEKQGFLTVIDFAYQGLGDGLDADAYGVRVFAERGLPLLITSSYSKNFGLYRERTGALTLVAPTPDEARAAMSNIKLIIRAMYSNPPAHGAAIVTAILQDADLRAEWELEVRAMCDRIRSMRELFVETLKAKGVKQDFSFLTTQRGMFSFSGLTPEQVDRLRDEFGVYIVSSGRINVAGLTPSNMDTVCSAIAAVLDGSSG